MAFKMISAIVAVGLLLAFLLPVAVKMKEVPLGIVILTGLVLMAWDLWESFREKDE